MRSLYELKNSAKLVEWVYTENDNPRKQKRLSKKKKRVKNVPLNKK